MSDFLAIGNNDLGDPIGETITCPHCGGTHEIEYGTKKTLQADGTWSEAVTSKLLGFYKCGDDLYLASLNGRALEPPR
jgi:hypothetical protein